MSHRDEPVELCFTVDDEFCGKRLDVFLSSQLTDYSRTQLKAAIDLGACTLDGVIARPAVRLRAGQTLVFVPPQHSPTGPLPEDIPLDILHEDDELVVVNKPADMVVHPARGHWNGTLASALAHRYQQLSSRGGPERPGIIHRLDRDTTGVIVVARTNRAHRLLSEQFASRTVTKTYLAITDGNPDRDRDLISLPITTSRHRREKMEIARPPREGRSAETFYEVTSRFGRFCSVHLTPKTGRTHQIRVHLAQLGCPVACDRLYGSGKPLTSHDVDPTTLDHSSKVLLDRQALHAARIEFVHPATGQPLTVEAPLANDMSALLQCLTESQPPGTR